MLVHALHFLRDQINAFTPPGGPDVELDNIARYNAGESFNEGLQNKILLSIINIEEDTVVRHVENFKRENNQILYKNPPIYLNLTVMFASTHTDYDSALISLESIILFFQRNRFYSIDTSPELEAYNALHSIQIEKMTFELCNFSMEQVYQLWGAFGNHYMPSVIYKIRMLQLDNATVTVGEPIKEIKIEAWHKKQKA
jgi:hypothetical protein